MPNPIPTSPSRARSGRPLLATTRPPITAPVAMSEVRSEYTPAPAWNVSFGEQRQHDREVVGEGPRDEHDQQHVTEVP